MRGRSSCEVQGIKQYAVIAVWVMQTDVKTHFGGAEHLEVRGRTESTSVLQLCAFLCSTPPIAATNCISKQ